jgi:adenylate cyclase
MRELVSDLLGRDPSVGALPELIHERTQGNPFFVEEVLQMLVEEGHLEGSKGVYRLVTPVKELSVPGSVQAILAARIDRLAEREKQVLQRASVIGKTFAGPVLSEIVELPDAELSAALSALQDVELIYEQALYPESEYAFKHPLTQQVAYESQLSEPRARVHAAVARVVEARSALKLDERAALLAHHWEQAGEALQAARWHHRAAEWVVKTDVAEAMRHWQSVLGLLANASDSDEAARLGVDARIGALQVAWRGGPAHEQADRLLEDGLALAGRLDDLRLEAELRLPYAVYRATLRDEQGRLKQSSRALEIAQQLDDAELDLIARVVYNSCLLTLGRVAEGIAAADAVISRPPEDRTLGSDSGGWHAFGFLLAQRGVFHVLAGRIEAGRQDAGRGLDLGRGDGSLESLIFIQSFCAYVEELAGGGEAALHHARAAADAARRFGAATGVTVAYSYLGRVHILRGEYEEACQVLHEAIEAVRSVSGVILAECYAPWVEAQLGVGDLCAARRAAEDAITATSHSFLHGGESWLALARLRIRTDEARDDVEAALAKAAGLLREGGIRIHEPKLHELRADLAQREGDSSAAEREIRAAQRLYQEMGAAGHAERVARELDS